MKEDAFESLQNMIGHQEDLKKLEASSATNNDEIRRIGLNIDINNEFNKIWYLILFGEFEEAANELKSFSLLSSEYLVYDSKAMINFYKLSGYLNLMSGNIDASISFYDQIPRALLEADNYQLYFYALAVNAKGKKNMEASMQKVIKINHFCVRSRQNDDFCGRCRENENFCM